MSPRDRMSDARPGSTLPRDRIGDALTRGQGEGAAIVAYLTAGYPDPEQFFAALEAVARVSDAVEIGVPFSDPMADGVTIQRSSEQAIEHGVSLRWIFDELARRDLDLAPPMLLMSYLNPLLVFGYEALAERSMMRQETFDVHSQGTLERVREIHTNASPSPRATSRRASRLILV